MPIRETLMQARQATSKLPTDDAWVLPTKTPQYTAGLTNFPVSYGCRNPDVDGFEVVAYYGEWGTVGILELMRSRPRHQPATAEKFEKWLTCAQYPTLDRVWHTNVLLALRNGEFKGKSESGDHAMYNNYDLMLKSAEINAMVVNTARPRLHVTLGCAAAVAFCRTHSGGDPKCRFSDYSRQKPRLRRFPVADLYDAPYPLADSSIVVHLCHPDMNHLASAQRRRTQPSYDNVTLLRAALEMSGLNTRKSMSGTSKA